MCELYEELQAWKMFHCYNKIQHRRWKVDQSFLWTWVSAIVDTNLNPSFFLSQSCISMTCNQVPPISPDKPFGVFNKRFEKCKNCTNRRKF